MPEDVVQPVGKDGPFLCPICEHSMQWHEDECAAMVDGDGKDYLCGCRVDEYIAQWILERL